MTHDRKKNRIRELRKAAGITQEELGARMPSDITGSTVAKLENGRLRLSLQYAEEIADVLGASVFSVLGVENESVRFIPLVGEIVAGDWMEAIELTEEKLAVPPHVKGDRLFALRIKGDSANKIVGDGGFVVVNPDERELMDGRYYAMMDESGDTTFKRFSASPLQLEPCSTNPNHKPIALGTHPVTVIGRVIRTVQEL